MAARSAHQLTTGAQAEAHANHFIAGHLEQIALIAAIVSSALAVVTLVLAGPSVWHYRRVPVEEEIPRLATASPIDQKLAPSLS
jgi:hypothetical protein